MNFTKRDTNIAKGIAICLMIVHHLFNSKARILEGNSYIPLLVYADAEIHIARFGKICIASFIFLSGYGLYLSFQKSNSQLGTYLKNKLFKFYPVFWAQFIVFVPIGFLFYNDLTIINQDVLRYVVDSNVILLSFFGLSSRFNGAWWFVTLYLELLLLVFPIYYYLINRRIQVFVFINLILFLLNYIYGFPVKLILYQTSFAFGMFCAKYNIFSSPLINKTDKLNIGIIAIIFFLCFPLRHILGVKFDFILAPVFIYSSIKIVEFCKMNSIFAYIGKYSFPMWLNHNFFALYFFQDTMYYPKYSPLIVLFVIISSLTSSVLIERIRCTVWGNYKKIRQGTP